MTNTNDSSVMAYRGAPANTLHVIAFIVLAVSQRAVVSSVLAVICAGYPVLVHLAWIFDLGRIATGSSTAALVFIFREA